MCKDIRVCDQFGICGETDAKWSNTAAHSNVEKRQSNESTDSLAKRSVLLNIEKARKWCETDRMKALYYDQTFEQTWWYCSMYFMHVITLMLLISFCMHLNASYSANNPKEATAEFIKDAIVHLYDVLYLFLKQKFETQRIDHNFEIKRLEIQIDGMNQIQASTCRKDAKSARTERRKQLLAAD